MAPFRLTRHTPETSPGLDRPTPVTNQALSVRVLFGNRAIFVEAGVWYVKYCRCPRGSNSDIATKTLVRRIE